VGSAATLGAGSTFRGTILAHDDISLGDAVTVDGRLLGGEQASGAGAVTLIHDTITVPTCTSGSTTGGTTGGSSTSGGSGTSGTTGGSTTGTSGTGGTTGGTTGTSTGTTGETTGGTTAGSSGGTTGTSSTTGTTGGTEEDAAAAGAGTSSAEQGVLPATGVATGPASLAGLLAVLLGAFCLLIGRRPVRATSAHALSVGRARDARR